MPAIKVCEKCGDAYWADVPCQTCAMKQVEEDARFYGTGWLRVLPNGAKERIAPEDIYIKTDEEGRE